MTLNFFRKLSWAEGISFLTLLFIAMPLKYLANIPEAVAIVGMAHGILFVAYIGFTLYFKAEKQWETMFFIKVGLLAFVPFGMLLLDKWLADREKQSND